MTGHTHTHTRHAKQFPEKIYELQSSTNNRETTLERFRFWYNKQLLTPYGCRENIFNCGGWPSVQTVTVIMLCH